MVASCQISIAPTTDLAYVAQVVSHPKIWRWITDDVSRGVEFTPPASHSGLLYLEARDEDEPLGLFMVGQQNAVCWDLHICLMPWAWGPRSRMALREAIQWMWKNTDCRRIVVSIPDDNRLAQKLVKDVGLEEYGHNPASWLRGGQLLGQTLLGISR